MKKKPAAGDLRRRAELEAGGRRKQDPSPPATEADARRMVHELQVHQIELEMQNQALAESRAETEALLRRYSDLYDFSPVGYLTLARDGAILQVNLAGAGLLGAETATVTRRRFGTYVAASSRATFQALLDRVFAQEEKGSCDLELARGGEAPFWIHVEATHTAALPGEPDVCHAAMSDITVRRNAEEQLRHLSSHDPLTGLYNRSMFVEEMARLARGRGFPVSIVMADMDDFKRTNDLHGHAVGDALLKRVAQALTAAFRAEDVIARIGGDEFAVLLPATGAAAANASLRRLWQMIDESNAAQTGIPIRLSLGVSTAEIPAPLSVVLNEADASMYREKRGRADGLEREARRSSDADGLRTRSEAELDGRRHSEVAPPATASETRRLVHELEVHQIELEMQNRELEQARTQTEAALRQYTDLYDFAPAGYFSLARDGTIRRTNRAGAALLGMGREGLIDRRFGLFISPESRAAFSAFLDRVFATIGNREICDVALPGAGGGTRWVHLEAGTEDEHECRAVAVEITERMQAEEALRRVDQAIASSTDLPKTLGILLEHVTAQLKVDAARVLLLGADRETLEYSAGRGFRTEAPTSAGVRLGEGAGGRAALEGKSVYIPDLRGSKVGFPRSTVIAAEGFEAYYGIPLVAKGQLKGLLEVFHRAPLDRGPAWLSFFETLAGQAAAAIDNAQLFDNLQRANLDLTIAYDSTIEGWSRALDLRDRETEGHTLRVTAITMRLAQAAGVGEADFVHIRRGALLHDIGKMGVPDGVLLKPDKLTDDEWTIMHRHPQLAFDMLSPISYLRSSLDIPYCHHERWDGTGYPRGLQGERVPLAARLFSVVDVWDALRSDRPYREAWPETAVLEHIRAGRGTHFDPEVADLFLRVVKEEAAAGIGA